MSQRTMLFVHFLHFSDILFFSSDILRTIGALSTIESEMKQRLVNTFGIPIPWALFPK